MVDKTPHEVWFGNRPSLAHPKVFRCVSFMHVTKEKINKLDNKAEKCIFIGYKDGVKGYKLWNLVTTKIIYSLDVILREVRDTSNVEEEAREK